MNTTCHDLAKWLSHYLFFFFFSFLFLLDLQLQDGAWKSITWLYHNVTVTECHMTKVTWGPWESKCIATVVKYISSRELSENSIKFSLSNSEQRDSWLNSGHWTLDADTTGHLYYFMFLSHLFVWAAKGGNILLYCGATPTTLLYARTYVN